MASAARVRQVELRGAQTLDALVATLERLELGPGLPGRLKARPDLERNLRLALRARAEALMAQLRADWEDLEVACKLLQNAAQGPEEEAQSHAAGQDLWRKRQMLEAARTHDGAAVFRELRSRWMMI